MVALINPKLLILGRCLWGKSIGPAREMALDPNLGNLALRDDEHGRPPRILDRQERDVRQIE